MKNKKQEKIFYVDLGIFNNTTDADWERYEGLLFVFGQYLFNNECGTWAGRETALSKETQVSSVNYWFVLESSRQKACEKIESLVKNFALENITKIKIGEAMNDNVKKPTADIIREAKEFNWVIYKTKK